MTALQSFLDLTAADLMRRDVVTVHQTLSLRTADSLLVRAGVPGVVVVDEQGHCVGMLSCLDFMRWNQGESQPSRPRQICTCSHQTQGHLQNGQEAVLCNLPPGSCAVQAIQTTLEGREAAVCRMPHDVLADWQQVVEKPSGEEVGSYMARNFLSVKPDTPLAEVIRKMIDVLSQHVVVLDEENKPLGILSAPDIVAALARERPGFSIGEGS